jgi:hypothetical protein
LLACTLPGLLSHIVAQGYPTIKHFKLGADGKKEAAEYNGARTASDLVQFAETRLDQAGSAAPIPEIVKTVRPSFTPPPPLTASVPRSQRDSLCFPSTRRRSSVGSREKAPRPVVLRPAAPG